MKIILTLCLFLVIIVANAQCIENVDQFTGDTTTQAEGKLEGSILGKCTFWIYEEGDSLTLRLYFDFKNPNTGDIAEGALFYLKAADGRVLELAALQTEEWQSVNYSGTIVRYISPDYRLTQEQLELLKILRFESYRIVFYKVNVDGKINGKNATSINTAAQCF